MEAILDVEKPDLVILTGDQLHHDILDSQTTLFKVVAPIIERSIPWAAVFVMTARAILPCRVSDLLRTFY
jgi:hypothetical protein